MVATFLNCSQRKELLIAKQLAIRGQVENWLDQELASFFENDDTTQIMSSALTKQQT